MRLRNLSCGCGNLQKKTPVRCMKGENNFRRIISDKKFYLFAVLVLVSSISVFLTDELARVHSYVFRATIPTLVLFVGWLVYSRSKGELKKFAIVLNLSVLLNLVGEILNTLSGEALKGGLYPSITDLFWIMAYIPIFVLVSMQIVKIVSNLNLKSVTIASSFLIAGIVAVSPLLNYLALSQLNLLTLLTLSAYPVLDLVVISMLIILFTSYYRLQINYYWLLLIVSFSFMAIGDTLGAYYKIAGVYRAGLLPDVCINFYYLTILVGLYIIYRNEVIKSYLDLYRFDNDPNYLKKVEDKIQHIIDVINDSREFEKLLNAGKLKEMDLKAEVEKAVSHFKDDAEFSINLDGEKVVADDLLSSVVYNLIHNSVRHNEKKVKLDIDARNDGEWIQLRISDNGKGIPEEFRERIFEEGFKYGDSGNTGLGLYLVKQTIDRYGGSIKIDKNNPSGAVFLIKLKKA